MQMRFKKQHQWYIKDSHLVLLKALYCTQKEPDMGQSNSFSLWITYTAKRILNFQILFLFGQCWGLNATPYTTAVPELQPSPAQLF